MAIVGVPGWIGSSAVDNTGQRWMSAAIGDVRLPIPSWMSSMAGRSKEVIYTISSNYNFNKDTLINWMVSQGAAPVVINVVGDTVSYNPDVPCLEFPSGLSNEYIQLNIAAGVTLYGRGGTGRRSANGGNGGNAINNFVGGRLRINNGGAIAGGGGAGGGGYLNEYPVYRDIIGSGGGGRPFGAQEGQNNMEIAATDGTLYAPGSGSRLNTGSQLICGSGGDVGTSGGNAGGTHYSNIYAGGAPGAALYGSAPTWLRLGNIYGSRL